MPVQSATIISDLYQEKPAVFQFFPLLQQEPHSPSAAKEETPCFANGDEFPEIFPLYPFI